MVELAAREARAEPPAPGKRTPPVSLAEIAAAQMLSLAYLEQLFGPLRRAGLVASARGPGGGYRLAYHAADITIKVTGHQWYWEYDYADTAKINFASRMIPNEEIKAGQLRLLDVDNQLVVPAGKNVRVLATSGDVIHSWFVPSLGVQRYAIPGRIIETWFRVNEPGTYYGECNQICGTQHSGMPISIKALPEAEFQAWLAGAKTKFASEPALIPAEKRADGRVELAQIQR
jgi:heme/copper-type cytochrome/quinol oxidase subunit 2